MNRELSPAVLRDAAALIDKYGLLKHDFGSKVRGFCATGAVRQVRYGTTYLGLPPHASGLVRLEPLIVELNDAPDTTKEDMVMYLLLLAETFVNSRRALL